MTGIFSLKSFLPGQFHTKDLGMLKYFLGVEVMRSKLGIFLSQRKYALDLLSETGNLAAKPCQLLAPRLDDLNSMQHEGVDLAPCTHRGRKSRQIKEASAGTG